MADQIQIGNYESVTNAIGQKFGQEIDKANTEYSVEQGKRQLEESIGSMKAFMSSKPVTKYVYGRGKAAVKDLVDKAGVKMNDFRKSYQAAKDGNLQDSVAADAVQNPDVIATAGTYGAPVYGAPVQSGLPGVPGPSYDNVQVSKGSFEGNPSEVPNAGEEAPHGLSNSYDSDARPPAYTENPPPEGAGEFVRGDPRGEYSSEPREPFSGEAEQEQNVGRVTKADNQFFKSAAKDKGRSNQTEEEEDTTEADVEGGGGAAEGGGIAGGEAATGVLDAIPGADIIGLIAGAGLALGAALHKPKEQIPVDHIQSSFQIGI
jgi:hypothetical protein